MNFAALLSLCPELKNMDQKDLQEIRLHAGGFPVYKTSSRSVRGQTLFSQQDVLMAAQALTGNALSLYMAQLQKGFVPLPGGHRMGVCGKVYEENGQLHLNEISSLCIRAAHAFPHILDNLFPQIKNSSVLLLGPPGSGKTTLLRELARLHAEEGDSVAIADERGEIAACFDGVPQLDVGQADVMTLMKKEDALLTLLRSMAPQWMITDELGSEKEAEAVCRAAFSGVRVIASVHASSPSDLKHLRFFRPLTENHVFDSVLVLSRPEEKPVLLPMRNE